MNVLKRIGKVFRSKIVKIALIAVVSLFALFKLWDCLDFARSRGSADAQEMAREEKLWKRATDIYNAIDDYYKTKDKAVEERAAKKEKYRVMYDADYFAFVPLDTVKIGKSASRCLAEFSRQKQQLRHFSDDDVFGYGDAEFTMCELGVKGFVSNLMEDELLFDAQCYYKQEFCDSDTLKKYYELYNKENKDEAFKYTDAVSSDEKSNMLPVAFLNSYLFCVKEHGGYRLWQGCSPNSVRAEYAAAEIHKSYEININGPARIRCLERRLQSGSKYAAFCLPVVRRFSLPLFFQKYTINVWNLYLFLLQLHLPAEPVLKVLPLDDKNAVHNYNFAQTCQEKWWRITNNLALDTENYLLFVKYSVNHKSNSGRLRHVHIMPKYGKNSAEMKLLSDNLAADLRCCRRKLNSAAFAGVPKLRQAGLEFCSASEEILRTWERYRQGKYDYKMFCRALKKNETVYENKRQALLSLRWDYLHKCIDDNFVYLCLSLYADGVSKTAVERVKNAKLSE